MGRPSDPLPEEGVAQPDHQVLHPSDAMSVNSIDRGALMQEYRSPQQRTWPRWLTTSDRNDT